MKKLTMRMTPLIKNKETIYSIFLFGLPILLAILFLLFGVHPVEKDSIHTQEANYTNEISATVPNPFKDIVLEAHAVIIKDINTGKVIFQKNSDVSLPIASITKIMTALVTTEYLKNPNAFVSIVPESLRSDDGDLLLIGERFNLRKLINYTLVSSSNDGAAAISIATQNLFSETSFIDKMNGTAKKIGMSSTYFLNETGLDQNSMSAGAFGSAADVALMLEYVLKNHPDIFSATREATFSTYSENGLYHNATNTNQVVSELPNLIGSKTGYTDLSGGNLAVIIDPGLNRPVSIIVLGSSIEGRFSDVKKLSDAVSKYFSYNEQNGTL